MEPVTAESQRQRVTNESGVLGLFDGTFIRNFYDRKEEKEEGTYGLEFPSGDKLKVSVIFGLICLVLALLNKTNPHLPFHCIVHVQGREKVWRGRSAGDK